MNEHPGRLHHEIPDWIRVEAEVYHIRIRSDRDTLRALTDPLLARKLLESVAFYESQGRWKAWLFLLMPDHCHALLSFPAGKHFRTIIGDWKRWHERQNSVIWQENFFDHRLRSQALFEEKWEYVRRNPVVKDLCPAADDWPWAYYGGAGNTLHPA